MKQINKAIYFLHNDVNIIHGDIKTDNILVTGLSNKLKYICDTYKHLYDDKHTHSEIIDILNIDNIDETIDDVINFSITDITISLTDFGFCNNKEKYNNYSFGTTYYEAPEIFLNGVCKKAVDIWALGCTFYELLTGKILFNNIDSVVTNGYIDKLLHLHLISDVTTDFTDAFLKTTKRRKKFLISN